MMIKLKILVTDLKALNMIKKLFWFYSYIRRALKIQLFYLIPCRWLGRPVSPHAKRVAGSREARGEMIRGN